VTAYFDVLRLQDCRRSLDLKRGMFARMCMRGVTQKSLRLPLARLHSYSLSPLCKQCCREAVNKEGDKCRISYWARSDVSVGFLSQHIHALYWILAGRQNSLVISFSVLFCCFRWDLT